MMHIQMGCQQDAIMRQQISCLWQRLLPGGSVFMPALRHVSLICLVCSACRYNASHAAQAGAAVQHLYKANSRQSQEQYAFKATVLLHVLSNVQFARLLVICAPYLPSILGMADALAEQADLEATSNAYAMFQRQASEGKACLADSDC